MALPPRRGGAHQTEVSETGTESPSGASDRFIGAEAAGGSSGDGSPVLDVGLTKPTMPSPCLLRHAGDKEIDYSWDRLSAVPEA